MISKKMHHWISVKIKRLQTFVDRSWYPGFIALLAALDNLVIIIPNDGILISSSMLAPKRWFVFSLFIAFGSTLGALALAALVELQGLPWILELYPGLDQHPVWSVTKQFFDHYGLMIIFLVAVTPIMQHPAVILASLANTPLTQLAAVIFVGRFIKFLIMAYVGSHAPRYLNKMWGVKEELGEVGLEVNSTGAISKKESLS